MDTPWVMQAVDCVTTLINLDASQLDRTEKWFSIAAAAATIMGFLGVFLQIRSAKRLQEQASARDLYSAFLQTAVDKSDVISTDPTDVANGQHAIAARLLADTATDCDLKYDWMMFMWLEALESGIHAFGLNEEWRGKVDSYVVQHHGYLQSAYFVQQVQRDFSRKLRRAIEKAIVRVNEGVLH